MQVKVHMMLFAANKYSGIDNYVMLIDSNDQLALPYAVLDDESDLPLDIVKSLLKKYTGTDGWNTLKIESCPPLVFDTIQGRCLSLPFMLIFGGTGTLIDAHWKKISAFDKLKIDQLDKQIIINTLVRTK